MLKEQQNYYVWHKMRVEHQKIFMNSLREQWNRWMMSDISFRMSVSKDIPSRDLSSSAEPPIPVTGDTSPNLHALHKIHSPQADFVDFLVQSTEIQRKYRQVKHYSAHYIAGLHIIRKGRLEIMY